MSLLERLMGATKKKAIEAAPKKQELLKQKLKEILYEDELVTELLPVFEKLQAAGGFDVIFELLESKEKQIETIANGAWFEKESPNKTNVKTEVEDQQDVENLVDALLEQKYGKK
jgi:predicted CopG family antitoxin